MMLHTKPASWNSTFAIATIVDTRFRMWRTNKVFNNTKDWFSTKSSESQSERVVVKDWIFLEAWFPKPLKGKILKSFWLSCLFLKLFWRQRTNQKWAWTEALDPASGHSPSQIPSTQSWKRAKSGYPPEWAFANGMSQFEQGTLDECPGVEHHLQAAAACRSSSQSLQALRNARPCLKIVISESKVC